MKIFSQIKSIISIFWVLGFDISLWKLFFQLNVSDRNIQKYRLRFEPLSSTKIQMSNTAHINIDGKLQIGYQLIKGASQQTRLLLQHNSELLVKGRYVIRAGSYIRIEPNSKLILHSGFMNENTQIICGGIIEIGADTLIGNDTVIRSDDGHKMMGENYHQTLPIKIGNHVWIGQGVKILKGVTIGDGCVIAAGAIVTKDIPDKCLAAGVPAKVIKENINWSRF